MLTDGNAWHLYLSMAAGEPTERRFCHHEIKASRDLSAMAADMRRYLSREAVVQGRAKSDAEQRLDDILNREQGRKALPEAWQTLLAEPDELLRDLLIESAEQATGSRPWREDAEAFLRESTVASDTPTRQGDVAKWLQAAPAKLTPRMKATVTKWRKQLADPAFGKKSPDGAPPKPTPESGKLSGIRIRGKEHEVLEFVRVHLLLASELEGWKGGLLDALAARVKPGMKNPRAVRASDPVLQTDRSKYYRQIPHYPEWYLHVHWSAKRPRQ